MIQSGKIKKGVKNVRINNRAVSQICRKIKVRDCLPDILALLQKYGLKTLLPDDMKEFGADGFYTKEANSLAQIDAGISLGGDGTFLQMARHLSPLKIPVFGVNFGKLGFFGRNRNE